tara:strand:+ start:727 stop:1806 length:1080 start_codon:yes stop_codon:yes gene_type:complete
MLLFSTLEELKSTYQLLFDYLNQNPFIHFVVLIVASIFVAKIIDVIFISFLSRLVKQTKTTIDDTIIKTLHRPIYYSFLFLGIRFSISVDNLNLGENIIFITTGFLKTLAILIWAKALFKTFLLLFNWYSSRSKDTVKQKLLPLFDNVGKIIIFLSTVYFIMISWGVNPVGWLASAGVLGVVLGLAAKDTLSNLFSGIFIMMDSPYKEGDYINLDSGERGYVLNVGIRSTRIMTRDDIEITIPNSVIANAKIINESGGPHENERIRLSIGVAYGSDLDLVKNILADVAKKSGLISEKFEPRVRFREFGESSLNFQLLFWIDKPEARGRTIDALNTSIYKEFSKNNIEIPFPQRIVHLKK